MTLTFDPFTDLERVTAGMRQARSGPRPMPVDLSRDQDRYVVTADLPGIDPGSLDIDLDGQLLTIRAYRSTGKSEGMKWINQERGEGAYLRQFSIGEGIDTEAISATYKDGVLSVILPLNAKAKPRKIEVDLSLDSHPTGKSITA
ncbi:Hsp20/alpha crystallin family protein [Leucobacter chromiireducens]|uniref:Hsp20/alpha crystallin family protein n=1 Tax=Leucobacter chromiireducens subsp. chromiireducens TaxID=660067 RepID=A0ABS1SR81_9MICO|nr:Hsp20/alpha crystallin family protein [Leucobacter chromiireducens]MBL3689642.1 Hsp20/alpha crystallin family protein [Leucobacter chromiireducens subsp. chromiireducens]